MFGEFHLFPVVLTTPLNVPIVYPKITSNSALLFLSELYTLFLDYSMTIAQERNQSRPEIPYVCSRLDLKISHVFMFKPTSLYLSVPIVFRANNNWIRPKT